MLQLNSHMSPNFAQERQALDPGSALLAKRQSESGNAFILRSRPLLCGAALATLQHELHDCWPRKDWGT